MRLLTGPFGQATGEDIFSPRIETARLVLRPLAMDDCLAMAAAANDVEVARWLVRVPHPYRERDAATFIEQSLLTRALGTALTLAMTEGGDDDARVIGVLALHSLDVEPEFGYWLGRSWWGRGYMGEAVEAMLAWAYGHIAIDAIRAGAFAGNAASLAIQARQGFVVTGHSRRMSLADGLFRPHVDTMLTHSAWLGRPRRR